MSMLGEYDLDEVNRESLECARYGEEDDLQELLTSLSGAAGLL